MGAARHLVFLNRTGQISASKVLLEIWSVWRAQPGGWSGLHLDLLTPASELSLSQAQVGLSNKWLA